MRAQYGVMGSHKEHNGTTESREKQRKKLYENKRNS